MTDAEWLKIMREMAWFLVASTAGASVLCFLIGFLVGHYWS